MVTPMSQRGKESARCQMADLVLPNKRRLNFAAEPRAK